MISIEDLRGYYSDGHIIFSKHVLARMAQRGISPSEIRQCVMSGEVIEQYPDDWPFPSCLISGRTDSGRPLHAVVSDEGGGGRVITAYEPNIVKFEEDLRTRRKKGEV